MSGFFNKLLFFIVLGSAMGAYAAPKSDKYERVYKYQSKKGITSFSDIEPIDMYYEVVKVGCFACHVNSQVDWYVTKLYPNVYRDEIEQAARLHNVEPHLVRAIIHAESHFRKDVVSKQGAQGLMQLMPATARELGVVNPFEAQENIQGGVKHLAKLFRKYYGNIKLVAAAYNSGEGTVKKYGGIPPYPETKVYIERVEILHKRYRQESI
jgi:soluble lytic murein transglycosylase-like protein